MALFKNLHLGLLRPWYIPNSWCGSWHDDKGRCISFTPMRGPSSYLVNIYGTNKKPFEIKELDGSTNATLNLLCETNFDAKNGTVFLQVEAGSVGLGPTFDLHFWAKSKKGFRPARLLDKPERLILRPSVGLGLYDDHNVDLGIPWAWPLLDYKKQR